MWNVKLILWYLTDVHDFMVFDRHVVQEFLLSKTQALVFI